MATVTYGFNGLGTPTQINVATANSQYFPGAVLTDAGNVALFYYENGGAGALKARLVTPGGVGTGAEVTVATGVASVGDFSDGAASAAKLSNGNIVVTWADNAATNVVHYRIYTGNLTPVTGVLDVSTTGLSVPTSTHPDVAALANGGFVIAWERVFNATDHDIFAQRYTAAGVADGSRLSISNSGGTFDELPSVAGLPDGGFVVAFDRKVVATGATAAWHAVVNADGTLRMAAAEFDSFGTLNTQVDVVATSGGGYTITYADNGWGNQDITSWRFSAAGASQGFAHTGSNAANEDFPASAVSPDGYLFVQYETATPGPYNQYGSLISPAGGLLASNRVLANTTGDEYWGSPVWLDASHILATWGANAPAAGTSVDAASVVAQVFEAVRTVAGDATGETLTYNTDGLINHINGNGGADTITTGAAADIIDGGAGDDIILSGSGADTVRGGIDNDTINGGAGNDFLYGEAGLDTVYGGDGNDFILDDAGASSVLAGEAGDDEIYGGAGNDYIVGGDGNDTMSGMGGQDSLYGGAGNDYIVAGSGVGSVVDGGAGANTLWGASGNDYIVGGEGADLLVGAAGSDYQFGNAGNDTHYGGQGTDYIYTNAGNDFVWTDDVGAPQSTDYVYAGGGTGVDTIADFTPGAVANRDVIVVSLASGVTNFAQAQANMSQVGVYTVLTLGADQVYIYNVQPFQLTADNFLFL